MPKLFAFFSWLLTNVSPLTILIFNWRIERCLKTIQLLNTLQKAYFFAYLGNSGGQAWRGGALAASFYGALAMRAGPLNPRKRVVECEKCEKENTVMQLQRHQPLFSVGSSFAKFRLFCANTQQYLILFLLFLAFAFTLVITFYLMIP